MVSLFWSLLDPGEKWIEAADRSGFMLSEADFVAAAQGLEFAELDKLADQLPPPRDAARWHVYSSWINAVARSQDPLASFYSPNRQEDVDVMVKAAMEGPGIDLVSTDGKLSIYTVDGRGPAAQAGVRPGSELLAVSDGSNWWETKGMSQQEVEEKLRGKSDSVVKIKVASEKGGKVIAIKRAHWILKEFRPTLTKIDGVSVIHLPRFYQDRDPAGKWDEGTEKDFKALIDSLGPEDKWVLDLRGNPGGVLDQALDVATAMGIRGHAWSLISKHAKVDVKIPASSAQLMLPDAVWVDRKTGSSAEALAGILSARNVVVVGEPTFGKTTMQLLFPLDPRGYSKKGFSKTGFLLMSSAHASWSKGPPGPLQPSCPYAKKAHLASQLDRGYWLATKKCLQGAAK